jgi:SAM-dependent methyltransferase
MHKTAEQNAHRFFNKYIYPNKLDLTILEIGSYIGGFNIRSLNPPNSKYVGVDLSEGPGVDVILSDPYVLPFDDNTFDYVISSSCFEHIDFFWLSYLEIMRVMKPSGIFYLNAPSNGDFHQYPIDSWRFFPDSGQSLIKWGNKNGFNSILLEQYTSNKESDIWSDYVGIFLKDVTSLEIYPDRIITDFHNYTNGSTYPHNKLLNPKKW